MSKPNYPPEFEIQVRQAMEVPEPKSETLDALREQPRGDGVHLSVGLGVGQAVVFVDEVVAVAVGGGREP